ncbi:hypothetical protein [Polyangium sp. y55x31]|uniref:hypothetical protein n=1 Tax=Polyangium sp. y55x31 TaxID=3042688 RepID=UPI002482D74C|nr:hypothetical protein [Polyangium sp. y55x31]MDI1475074.1 hypothetical protein [Polyangium sp. y55x31]
MAVQLTGPVDFAFARRSVGPSRPPELLAKVSKAGTLLFVVDRYEITFQDGGSETVYLERLERLLGLDEDPDRGFYEADSVDTEPDELLETLFATETKRHVGLLRSHFEARSPVEIEVHANVVYRLMQDDWDAMLAFLNERLPEEGALGIDEMRNFDVEAMIAFDPEEDEPAREDGTGFVMYFREQDDEDDGLPLLGLCILAHAVVHDIDWMDVEEEPLYDRVLLRAG